MFWGEITDSSGIVERFVIGDSNLQDVIKEAVGKVDRVTLKMLLKDKTTKKNIIWATNTYTILGLDYGEREEIRPELVFGINNGVIQSRAFKALEDQHSRTRSKAEVFTPSWVCNKMNNHCDEEWFGKPEVFNIELENAWTTVENKVTFPEGKSWQDYVESKRIEITCGEAPYIVSRYDTTTGAAIAIQDRIGLLDRKLRVVKENVETETEWKEWVTRAFQSVYGYEFQGDNLLVARINLLMTFIEYYEDVVKKKPETNLLRKIANIIVWNFWQMDGLTDTVPFGKPEQEEQTSWFDTILGGNEKNEEITPTCRIYDWKANRSMPFTEVKKG